jgi:hypothetical protein
VNTIQTTGQIVTDAERREISVLFPQKMAYFLLYSAIDHEYSLSSNKGKRIPAWFSIKTKTFSFISSDFLLYYCFLSIRIFGIERVYYVKLQIKKVVIWNLRMFIIVFADGL